MTATISWSLLWHDSLESIHQQGRRPVRALLGPDAEELLVSAHNWSYLVKYTAAPGAIGIYDNITLYPMAAPGLAFVMAEERDSGFDAP